MRLSHIHEDKTGIDVQKQDNRYFIYYNKELIKTTKDPYVAETFENSDFVEEIVSPTDNQGWEAVQKPIIVYKATNTLGTVVPGFTSVDKEEAEHYWRSDWGGEHIVKIKTPPLTRIDEAVILSGREGPIIFLPGMPSVLKRGIEVVVLVPVEQNRT